MTVPRLWDLATGELVRILPAHPGKEGVVRFMPDGRSVITGTQDGLVKRWDVRTGVETGTVSDRRLAVHGHGTLARR